MKLVFVVASVCALAIAASPAAARPGRPGRPAQAQALHSSLAPTASGVLDARIDSTRTVHRILYSHPAALVRGVAPDGANGVNAEWEHGQGPGMYIEEQRHGEAAIIAGLVIRIPSYGGSAYASSRGAFTIRGRAATSRTPRIPFTPPLSLSRASRT